MGISFTASLRRLLTADTANNEAWVEQCIQEVKAGQLEPSKALSKERASPQAAKFDAMSQALSARIGGIRNNAAIVAMAGQELTDAIKTLAQRSNQQQAALVEAVSQIEQVGGIANRNADVASDTQRAARTVHEVVESGAALVGDAVQQVKRIEQNAKEMAGFISAIDAIAFQTNILALNAAVEAARAGEQGRGFAVVASEVRVLAQRSAEAAAQIRRLIEQSSDQVRLGVGQIEKVHVSLGQITGNVRELSANAAEIAQGSATQRDSLGQILASVRGVGDIATQNAELVSTSAQAATELDLRSTEMFRAAAAMRLRQGSADEARQLVEKGCALIQRDGLSRAAQVFQDRSGPFFDRDMYLFVFNRDGIFTAFGPRPELAGRHLREIAGLQWERLLQHGFDVCANGGGWVDYSTVNPVTQAVTPKVSFVSPLPGDKLIGCGVYKL